MVWSYHSQISRLTVATAKVYGFWCYNMAKFDFITSEQASSNCLLFSHEAPILVRRPLPDFIIQLWRKSEEGLAPPLCHEPEMVDSIS